MGFDSLIRDAIGTINTITESLQGPVTHTRWVGEDARGKMNVDPAPATYQAIIEKNPAVRFTRDGVLMPVRLKLIILEPLPAQGYAGREEPIDVRDVFTLADGTTGPILGSPGILDPTTTRPYFAEVLIGDMRRTS